MGTESVANLSIKPGRLAGSASCHNCGKELEGAYCYFCGQPDRHLVRVFPTMMRELLEDAFDLDSRFARTLRPLLLQPGRLTLDYLAGKRFRYTPPLRLYIFASMAFFVIAALASVSAINVTPPSPGESNEVEAQIQFNDRPWDLETNPVVIPGMPASVNKWINEEIAQSPRKLKALEENPSLIAEKLFDVAPQAMFVLLPVFALILKVWYLFARRYYYEHLIFSLHNHAFMFVCLTMAFGLEALALWVDPSETGWVYRGAEWLSIALLVWIPLYLLVAQKRMYEQGWLMTVIKYWAVGMTYLIILSFALLIAAVVGFISL